MGIRIQPLEIKVPNDDPFRNDLLSRKESVEVLTHLVGSLEGPCVLAVDAAWGNGKTTFLNIWALHLRNQGFPIVKFNAWETDFSGDPFVALSTELTEGFQGYVDKSMAKMVDDTKERAKEVLRRAAPGVIRLATAGILDINPLMEKEVGQALVSYAEERLSAYQQAKDSVQEFRHTLQRVAAAVSKSKGRKPLIMMIDELDRCRPSYAVELLEVAKHLFAVDHIVFVLAVNRSELAHSIKSLYGAGFDAQGYLRRFFDVDFRLPEPDRAAFINQMLVSTKIDDYFKRTQDMPTGGNHEVVKKWLQGFFYDPSLSLRRVAQVIHRLGLVFASLRSDQLSLMEMAAVALILRTLDADLYHKFVRGDITDADVVDKVFSRPEAKTLRNTHEGHLFEAAVIFAIDDRRWTPEEPNRSQLLQRYHKLIGPEEFAKLMHLDRMELPDMAMPRPNCSDHDHARAIIILVLQGGLNYGIRGYAGFKEAVRRLELFSPDLIGDPAKK